MAKKSKKVRKGSKGSKSVQSLQIQQGDVLLEAAAIPAGCQRVDNLILAHGETTGHMHVAQAPVDGSAELLQLGEQLFLRILGGDARVVHEEHGTITVPPGDYQVSRVKEYDYDAAEARNIAD